jgi:hypothetical protein
MDINIIYSKVNTFSDLLDTNIKFFRGEINETYYYGAPWGKGEDQNNHAIVSTENLIKLTKDHRIFSTNGQSSYSDKVTDQRSYLMFYMEKETFEKIKEKLLKDERIWTIFIQRKDLFFFKNFSITSSLHPSINKIVLTKDVGYPYSIWKCDEEARLEFEETCFDNINDILKETIYCLIVCKEWNTEPNADTILLNHFT